MSTPPFGYDRKDPQYERGKRAGWISVICAVATIFAAGITAPIFVIPAILVGLVMGIYAIRVTHNKSVTGWIGLLICGLFVFIEAFLAVATF
ncbi:MAG TPA: hypothetical protein VHX86_15355 [Tepidisphaeraceae bacterium]|jgi:hypothetical protein|nr:hypothetical protein [Tepidisphaeraceae bacterium]